MELMKLEVSLKHQPDGTLAWYAHLTHLPILIPRAYNPSGLRQESRVLGATISGMRHRCRLPETGWAEFGDFLCYFKMVAPRALVFQPLVKGNEALGTRLVRVLLKIRLVFWFSVFWIKAVSMATSYLMTGRYMNHFGWNSSILILYFPSEKFFHTFPHHGTEYFQTCWIGKKLTKVVQTFFSNILQFVIMLDLLD